MTATNQVNWNFKGIDDSKNIKTESVNKDTDYTVTVKAIDGATNVTLNYNVSGDDVVVSKQNEYVLEANLSGKVGDDTVEAGTYTFRLNGTSEKWETTFTKADGTKGTITLETADLVALAEGEKSLTSYTNVKLDTNSYVLTHVEDGVLDTTSTNFKNYTAYQEHVATNNSTIADTEVRFELTLTDYAKAPVELTTMTINSTDVDAAAVFKYNKDGDDYTGSRFKESVTGTSANETFNMGTNGDVVTFKGFFGDDVVTVNKGETIDLKIQTVGGADATVTKTETAEGLLLTAENVYTMSAKGQIGDAAAQDLTFTLVNTGTEDVPVGKWACNEISELVLDNKSELLGADAFYNATGVNVNYTVEGEAVSIKLSNADLTDTLKTAGLAAAYKAACNTDNNAVAATTGKYNAQYSGSVLVKGYTDVDTQDDTATLTINNSAVSPITNVEAVSNTYEGSWLNEQLVSTSANETFALGTGNDILTFNGNFGNDVVIATNGTTEHASSYALNINNGAQLKAPGANNGSLYTITTNGSDLIINSSVDYYATVTIKTGGEYNNTTYTAGTYTFELTKVTASSNPALVGKYIWKDVTTKPDGSYYESSTDHSRLVLSVEDIKGIIAGDFDVDGGGASPVTIEGDSFHVYQWLTGATEALDVTDEYKNEVNETFASATEDEYTAANASLAAFEGSGQITLKDYAQATATLPAVVPTVTINGGAELASGTAPYETFRADNITSDYSGSRLNETVTVKAGTTSALTVDLGNGNNSFTGQDGNTTVFAGTGANTIVTGAGADTVTVAGGGANEITTGAGNDTINIGDAKEANNTINAGTGNDTIYTSKSTGAGVNTINIYVGDGNETLYSGVESDGKDKIAFQKDSAVAGASTLLTYTKKGEDLVISRDGLITGPGTKINDSVTIKGYLGEEKGHNIALGLQTADPDTTVDAAIATIEFENDVKSGVIKGSWAKDNIVATGDATVTANGGIDTVTLAKDSTNTVIYNVGDAPAGEKLTLSAAEVTNLVFNAPKAKEGSIYGAFYTFEENIAEHKLIITRTYYERKADGSNNWATASDPAYTNDVIEITDYLTNGKDAVTITDSLAISSHAAKEEYTPYLAAALEDVATIAVDAPTADFNGSFLSENITAHTSADSVVKTGAGNDTLTGNTFVQAVTLGAGNKTFNYNTANGGKDTIELTKDVDKLVIDLTNIDAGANKTVEALQGALRFNEDLTDTSKDLVISDSTNGATHNVTVKDYFKNGAAKVYFKGSVNTAAAGAPAVYEDTLIALEDVVTAANNKAIDLVAKSATEGATFEGSLLAETVNGTALADVIATGDGNDVITAGAGDDEIFGGEGANVYHFGTNSGNDTVYMTGEAETLVFDAPDAAGVTFDMTKEDTYSITSEFSEDKKDVIITVVAKGTKDAKEVVYTDTVTLKDYMDGESQGTLVSYKEWDESTKQYVDRFGDITKLVDTASLIEEKGNKVTGTDLADNLVFDDNKSRTIYGLAGNDNIYVSGGKNTIYAGAGDDFITSGAGADTIDGGEGNNMLYFVEGSGKDVVLNGEGNDTLNFTVADESTFKVAVKGKDLVFTYGEKGDTVTVKDYAKQVLAGEDHSVQSYVLNGKAPVALTAAAATTVQGGFITLEAPDTTKPANLKGSTLAETLVGSEGNNVLNGGGGNDIIWSISGSNKINTGSRAVDVKKGVLVADNALVHAGIGNDVITAGKGNDTYVFQQGMLNGTINANTVGNVTIDLSAQDFNNLQFSIKGKDLVISNTYNPYGFGKYTAVERLYVKNYVNNKLTDNIKINDGSGAMNLADYLAQVAHVEDGVVLGDANAYKAQKLTGSFLNETFLGGAGKDTISTGAGQDTVFAGAGDDKITGYIAKVGKEQQYYDVDNAKTFVFDYSYDKDEDVAVGSGNDTIVNAKLSDTIVFRLADKNIKDAAAELAENLTLTQKGKNLIIGYNETVNAKGKTVYADSITLNNYFGKNVESVYSFAITDTEGRKVAEFDMDDFENGVLKSSVVTAIKTAANTAQGYDTNKSTVAVTAAANAQDDLKGNTTFNAVAGTGERTITDEKGNDTYNMTLVGQTAKTTINDSEGLDKLVVTTQSTGFALFNVKADGTVAAGDTSMFVGDSANLTLDNKVALQTELKEILNLAGNTEQAYTIEVANQFKEGSVEDGAGAMEQVAFTNGGINARTYDVDAVKANVASWLTAGGYADTAAALENADNAATLLNLYMGGQA